MTTVITSKGANFTVPGLPMLSRIIADGLLLAVRPSDTSGIEDISGNTVNYATTGNPQLTEFGLRTTPRDYITSNVIETGSNTMIAGFRFVLNGTFSGVNGVIGSMVSNAENYQGSGLAAGNIGGAPNYLATVPYVATSATTRQFVAPKTIQTPSPTPPYTSPWVWAAAVLNEAASTYDLYTSIGGAPLSKSATLALQAGALTRNKGNIVIGSYPDLASDTGMNYEIAEALSYSRALAESEINQQFNDFIDYMTSKNAVFS